MKFTQVFLIFAIVAAALASSPSRAVSDCPNACTEEYAPVCGSSNNCIRPFSNRCQLLVANCKLRPNDRFQQVDARLCNNFKNPVFDRCLKQLY